jgi:glucokinase-like ROK family protein
MVVPLSRPGLREVNREQILRTILRNGPLARVDLAHLVGLTTAAISNITRELIEDGLLYEVGTARGKRVGASAILLDMPEDTLTLGVVHQGVSALRIALSTLRGHLIARCIIATPTAYAPEWAATTIAHTLRNLIEQHGYQQSRLVGVGAGLVGLIDAQMGVVKRAPRLGWESVPLGALLAQELHCPVAIENNVRAMAFGEALLGEGRDKPDFAFVYVGTGIGSGLIINGRPYRGAYGGAGEIGHITIVPNGERCSCGNDGCLETIAAEPAIVRRMQTHGLVLNSAGGTKETVQALATLARQGDSLAQSIVIECGESLGVALATLVDLFNPERIVLHGAIAEAGDIFFSSVARTLQQRAFSTRNEAVELVAPTFGIDAGLIGAAAIALDTLVLTPGRILAERD